ncbi:segregation and condensation protein B [Bradyrhizobium sp. USDA 4341]
MADAKPTGLDPVVIVESAIAVAGRPVSERELASYLPDGTDLAETSAALDRAYAGRGIAPVLTAGGWVFRTRPSSSGLAVRIFEERHALGRAATETAVAIALFAPVTRSEIERVRGVTLAKGTMDALLLAGLIRPGPRRDGPGRPLTWMPTERFLELYDLDSPASIPQWKELRDEGLDDMRRSRGAAVSPDEGNEQDEEEPDIAVFDDEVVQDDLLQEPSTDPGVLPRNEK